MIRIGVDTGGTFTDLVLVDDEDGLIKVHKVRSTPSNPAIAILEAIGAAAQGRSVAQVSHGSTVATNALLERKGARVAMVTTAGFEDVLMIGRQTRSRLYDFQVQAPRPIVESELIFGVSERLDHRGRIVTALGAAEVERLAEALIAADVECVAVCLLHSYANPVHEQMIATHLRQRGLEVSASHDILPEYREFERWSTTAVNAYVTPIMSRYLGTLEVQMAKTRLHVMQSNGGTISAEQARSSAVRTILSGPAAGAVGAQTVARASGFDRIILFDMGGTSTDVSLVDRHLGLTSESIVGGCPVRLPMLDIHTIGAGGGSIAYRDIGGSLRVGPRSAGADPGPVCYGKGEELTVSDANLLLGRLPAEHFLGGRMRLDLARTLERARTFAVELGLSVERLAEGIIQVANANMERAIRAVSVQRGHDPRDFALFAFGGAGGMHACQIAETMEIGAVLIPRHAGVLSALGMLLADVRKDYSQTILLGSEALTEERAADLFAPIVERARQELQAEGFRAEHVVIQLLLDVRYRGQAYEISIPFRPDFVDEFHARHQLTYGYANSARPTEVVNLRVEAAGITRKHVFPSAEAERSPLPEPLSTSQAWFDGQIFETPVYAREDLLPGAEAIGPAILAGGEATVVIPPRFQFRVDGVGTVIAKRMAAGAGLELVETMAVGDR